MPDPEDALLEVARELVEVLEARGHDPAEAEDLIVALLDALVQLPEPLESLSDEAIERSVVALSEMLKRSPERMRFRAKELEAAGKAKRARALRRRARRVEDRQRP